MNCKYQTKIETTQYDKSIAIVPNCAELRVTNLADGTVFFGGMPIPTQQAVCFPELRDSCYDAAVQLYIPAGVTGVVHVTRSTKSLSICPV